MIDKFLFTIKKFIPKKLFQALQPYYHFLLAGIASFWYRNPSNKMIVIGVTGTTGKTTSVLFASSVLRSAGLKTGHITTAVFSDGEKDWLNNKKMTMVGRFFTQKLLRKMADNNCDVAIVETTSEGIVQFRHKFINYDTLAFTGLYPEHIESHGGFENYKKAKGKLFEHLENCKKKTINGKEIKKNIIVNGDDEHAEYFLNFPADKKIAYMTNKDNASKFGDIEKAIAENVISSAKGISFTVDNRAIAMKVLGGFNVSNALSAITIGRSLDISLEEVAKGLEKINSIPGRLEKIDEGQNFTVIVDYAFEPNAVSKLYETIGQIPHQKIIHVLGSTGGGRDKARRPKLGKLASQNADLVIVTNEDPYDEDPMQIIEDVARGIEGGIEKESFWKILDRREAIKKALELARRDDMILVTGKGNEQAICVAGGEKIDWDDRKIVSEELKKLSD